MKPITKTFMIVASLSVAIILIVGIATSVILLKGVSITQIKDAWRHLTEKKVTDIQLNKNTLYLSQPVTGMDGKLTAVQGNTITVTHHFVLSSAVGNIVSDQKTKDVAVRFSVMPQTKIFRPATWVPYLFKQNVPNADETLKLGDLKIGQFVAVTTNDDLQIAQSDPYQATSIQITRIANNISGTISAVTGTALTVSAPLPPLPASFPPQLPLPTQTYTVSVTADTEISQREYNEGAPHQLDASSLIKGTPVAVYTAQDVGVEHNIAALLITVFDRRPVPSSSSAGLSASPSAVFKPIP